MWKFRNWGVYFIFLFFVFLLVSCIRILPIQLEELLVVFLFICWLYKILLCGIKFECHNIPMRNCFRFCIGVYEVLRPRSFSGFNWVVCFFLFVFWQKARCPDYRYKGLNSLLMSNVLIRKIMHHPQHYQNPKSKPDHYSLHPLVLEPEWSQFNQLAESQVIGHEHYRLPPH